MDSPEPNRIPAISSPASSPAVQESPLFSYLSTLSPIRSSKVAKYARRFSQTDLPIPLPVFTSPHIDFDRQTSFLKRKEIDAAGSDVYGQSDMQLKAELIPCSQKEVCSCSPSECADEYLADHVADVEDAMNFSDICERPDNDASKFSTSGFASHKEAIAKADDINVYDNANARVLLSCQARVVETEATMYQKDNERFNEFPKFESDVFLDSFSGAQHHEQFVVEVSHNIELQPAVGQHNKLGAYSLSFPESLQNVEAYKDSAENSKPLSIGSVKEADQQQRGIRRHLQFGAAMVCKRTGNETHDTDNLSLPIGVTNFENLVPPHVEPKGISSGWQGNVHTVTSQSSFSPSESFRSAQNCGKHAISACIPSGLGLHLNNVIKSVSMGSGSTASKNLAGKIYTNVGEDDQQENQAAGSASSQSTNSLQPPGDSLHATPFEQQETPYEGRMRTSKNKMAEELNQVNPIRNRKKAKYTSEIDGCKRCNCKRSKCLKLYCECFAAGIYCLDSCSCKNCFNKPEYEDTVLDTRQQIESRNPLAFAPKVVKHATNSPANMVEEGNWTTPSSARHKRGCNCKKSKCVKKYCECYQARVGCSDGCRCEGCNNPFGQKLESIKAGKANQSSPTWEEVIDRSHLISSPHPHSATLESSSSLNIRDCSNLSRAQSHRGSSHYLSSGYLRWRHSPNSLTSKFYGRVGPPELSSDSFLDDIMMDDDTPEILKNSSTPTKAVKVGSPNQKRESPSQIRSQELRSSSSQAPRSGRKFILQAVPSFPPLSPYSKLTDCIHQNDGNCKVTSPTVSDRHM